MANKPILFNTEMVEAILDGRKTQTRRLIRCNSYDVYKMSCFRGLWREKYDPQNPPPFLVEAYARSWKRTPCNTGDILWVRETWCIGRVEYGEEPDGRNVPYISQCIGDDRIIHKEWVLRNDVGTEDVTWKPSIFMPKEAARIFLRVKGVHVERLQDITEEQAEKEGCSAGCFNITYGPFGNDDDPDEWTAKDHFMNVWNSTIKESDKKLYDSIANPWVWVIEFERCEKPEGWCE